MKKIQLKKKKVTVMGIGLHGGGVQVIKWLSQQGARVIATDKGSREDLTASLEKIKDLKNVTTVIKQHRMEDFTRVDMVIKNPVVPWTNQYIKAALDAKVPVEMDSSLFFELCPSKKIIGITGTKGKTTTASLVAEILKEAGKPMIKVGVGQGAVMDKLEKIKKKTYVVFELSSWRLSALRRKKISPRYAVITNLFPDHLNYYGSMEKYVQDKRAIFENQKSKGVLVVGADQEETKNFAQEAKGRTILFSKNKKDFSNSVYIEEGELRFSWEENQGAIIKINEIKIRGRHNLNNILAACAIALVLEIPVKKIRKAILGFRGVAHRLEFVRRIDTVSFYNDTTATMPEAAMAAIDSFERPLYLIAGGSNKELDLNELAQKISTTNRVRKVYLLKGAATESLLKKIKNAGGEEKIVNIFDNINEATKTAHEDAKNNEEGKAVVLLSPGCASFGMFINEFDRGERFKVAVGSL